MIHCRRLYNVQLSGIAKRTDMMTRNGLTRLEDQDQTPLLYISASPQKEGLEQRLTFRKTSETTMTESWKSYFNLTSQVISTQNIRT